MVYLIPTVLYEGCTAPLPAYILEALQQCQVLFVENERTARRYLKLLLKDIVIDSYEWFGIKETTADVKAVFLQKLKEGKTVGIISEAGCPGIADPGQHLVQLAQEQNVVVKPLTGPNSILLALMASGMNGQHFSFLGYLPIEAAERIKAIRAAEQESKQRGSTQIFIETPYRNNVLMETLVKICGPQTRLCVAVDITADSEKIQTKTVSQWKEALPQLHKKPAIFLLMA